MRIVLDGGGNEFDSVPVHRFFADLIGAQGRLLYLPIALGGNPTRFATAETWLRSVFKPSGLKRIEMWTDLEQHSLQELDSFDGLYIGGGNAFALLEKLRASGFVEGIKSFCQDGRPTFGGSAGAVMLGRSIATVRHLDANEHGIKNLTGLDLLQGFSVWVHYRREDPTRIQNYMSETRGKLIVLSERAGVLLENGELRSLGYDQAHVAQTDSWKALPW